MKENFFKTYFKTFGVFTFLLFVALFVGLGILGYVNPQFVGKTVSGILKGTMLVLFPALAVVGISKLTTEKVGLIDFLRLVGFVSSIVLLIMGAVTKSIDTLGYILYIASAVAFAVELGFRFKFADDQTYDGSFKNYFGALAGGYNPLLILVIGVALAVVGTIFLKNGVIGQLFGSFQSNKFLFFGIALGAVAILLVPALDRTAEVSILDLLVAAVFVASVYLTFVAIPVVDKKELIFLMIMVVTAAGILLIRAVSYNKGRGYENPAHKIRTYFKQTYETYDPAFALTVGGLAVLFFGLAYACALGDNPWARRFGLGGNGVTIYSILTIVCLVAFIALIFVFRKFKSTKVEKVDWVLISLFFATASVITTVIATAVTGSFEVLTKNAIVLVALIVTGLAFIVAAVVQFIRLRNYDPVFAVVSAAPEKEEPVEEEVAEEQPAEEEVEEEKEEEPADPFALTEEDEKIYESVYGKDEEEEAEEEVAEEQPAEEVVYEEETTEEETPVEEAPVEEAPAEEETPAEEEPAEEDEDEVEDEEEEAEDEVDEYAGEPEEEVEELPVTKESEVIVQDFQIVDEEGKPKKIKRRFNSKMMFAPYETKEYYNEIKNYLQLYRAKGRYSARCESYRYKGLVAKVALGGKSIKVFLAIDPSFIDENPKYHLKNVSDKKQYAEVPVMMKVRSQRALKYFKELVDYMFANRLVKPKRNYTPVNYMPQLIPNGEAIMATLGMSTDYLHNTMNVHSIPDDMPDNLEDYIPMIPGEDLGEEEVEANVYLDTLCNHFEDGDEITIDVLKTLHIVNKGNVLRIKARGTLDRKLIIYAEYFDADALKMLMCTNCTAIKIIRNNE
ncbi:MAG: hypothetical protein IJS83_04710 [Acholeplasmatales bacterium]|nr:hypothetical protein [Acholeplasmatales bacterium]